MQTCGRCCRRSVIFGIDRLIAVLILEFVCDIRRQGHLSQLVQDLLKDSFIGETDQAVALIHNIDDLAL